MVKINYSALNFDHMVVFSKDNTIFACCRENSSGKTRLFLIFDKKSGHVYTRNGCTAHWEILGDFEATLIRDQIKMAVKDGITTYKFNGHSAAVTGQLIPVAG
jgi:hypothetical protein